MSFVTGINLAGGGKILSISSDAARVGSSGEAVYAACKGGIIAFSKTLARELARLLGGTLELESRVGVGTTVTGIEQANGRFHIQTSRGIISAEYVVNAAGLFSDKISAMIGKDYFSVTFVKCQMLVLENHPSSKEQ